LRTPPQPERAYFGVTGIPVVEGRNESLDIHVATRVALLEMIEYLVATRGVTREAAYVLCSAAVDFRLSQIVDAPNPTVSAFLPLDVFDGGPS
jgi:formamidase